ncbi:class I SAM-dependent methyltransferase [Mesorhizobium sp. ZC-5]|uniref:class I SAM-dependent methyltransferase n=1 Tax=Mesorhizobium sp. ZC-5 TaxID=2986066 RepID=UPI0021E8421C|nr:class I SAM-dependent methyltransferase [Mesorhizobium sp. ZC-5]MCV3243671.1 class I SAM-dependent methyltransferase [Mesorhizobium sp. ZC-5]
MNLPPENIFGHTKKLAYILDHLRQVAEKNPSATVLDFGCGNGSAVSQYIVGALREAATYVGVDIHTESIAYANKHFGKPNARFTNVLPEAGTCDMIVYADVLEHLDQPLEMLREHQRLLKPGGVIVGSIPNGVGPFEIESAIDRRFQISRRIARARSKAAGNTSAIPYNSDSGHLQFYRKKPFLRMIEDAGFHVTEFKNGTFFGAMVTERVLRLGGTPLMRANTAVAEVLPYWAVSTWLFAARR